MRSNTPVARTVRESDVSQRPPKPEAGGEPPSRFEVAAARAMARHSPAEWALLEPTKRTDAIYAELRRLDSEFSPRQG